MLPDQNVAPMTEHNTPILFAADIRPNRSLSRRGLMMLVATLATGGLITSLIFIADGAWPIALYNAAELIIVVALLHSNMRAARAREWVVLTPDGLHVTRVDKKGRRFERYLSAAWARVQVEERPGRVSALYLASHGQRIEVASCLGEAQKLDLAEALKGALYRFHNPVFDNPQLREE